MLRPLPDLPWVSAFPELNLRLYVEVDGKPGVWFISLDAANPLAVWAARRFFHLPYFHARMEAKRVGDRVSYRSERRASGRVAFRGDYWPVGDIFEAKPGTIEHFLTERYCLYAQASDGAIIRANIHHPPWSLQVAKVDIEENTIASAQGIDLKGPPALLHVCRRLDVVVWPIDRLPAVDGRA